MSFKRALENVGRGDAAIMGTMVPEAGQLVTFDQAMAPTLGLAPGLEKLETNSPPPCQPGARGRYPVALPGQIQVL